MSDFEIVDVFAGPGYVGNPLAVVWPSRPLERAEMQAIAHEFNFSETTFVGPYREPGPEVRIFTPDRELPFAGHPTLGTAALVRERIGNPDSVLLDLQVGPTRVDFEAGADAGSDLGWIRAPIPRLGNIIEPERVARLVGLQRSEVDPKWPAQVVTSGIAFLLVPVRDANALARVDLDLEHQHQLVSAGLPLAGVLAFTAPGPTRPGPIRERVLFEVNGGVREDPATGSANAALAGYLLHHHVLGEGPLDVRAEQGSACSRPSLLHLRGTLTQGVAQVQVGGRVTRFARGQLQH